MKKITAASISMLSFVLLFTNCATTDGGAAGSDASSEAFSVVLEAENAVGVGTIVDTKHVGYTGDGFVDYKPNAPGGTITWTADIPADGSYKLVFRYAHAEGNRPLEIKVNGEVVEKELAFNGTGDWANWQEVKTTATLKKGTNEIVATSVGVEGGGNIDSLTIMSAAGINFNAVLEAETALGVGTVVDTKHVGYTGDGFVDFKPNAPGGTLEWTVDVPATGDYTLGFRYAHAEGNRPLEVKINGEVAVKELAFNGTGDWANWQMSTAPVKLNQGKNTILVTALGVEGGGNIDSLTVTGGVSEDAEEAIDFATVPVTDMVSDTVAKLLKDKGLFIDGKKGTALAKGDPAIESAYAITDRLILVTFNTGFLNADPMDVLPMAATGLWSHLNPKLEYMKVSEVAVGANKENKTVYLYKLVAPYKKEIRVEEQKFSGDIESAHQKALNMITWQMEHGGWDKDLPHETDRPWDGTESKSHSGWITTDGTYTGTIDNDGTIKEIKYLSEIYRETKDPALKDSVLKGFDFLFKLQTEKGGIKQVYPQRGAEGSYEFYSNYATFNDGAMMNVLLMYEDIISGAYPYDSDLYDDALKAKLKDAVGRGVDFILKSQIKVDGVLTGWCAQHDPNTYEPMGARAYELPSISGMESVNIIKFLMGRPQTPEVKASVDAAINWLDSVKVKQQAFYNGEFHFDANADMWYRFYDLETMQPIFSGRDGVKKNNIMEIEDERRLGYSWAGTWPNQLLSVAKSTGYFEGKYFASVVATNSSNLIGQRVMINSAKEIVPYNGDLKIGVTVKADGSGDFTSIQDAFNAVPAGNTIPFTITLAAGTYEEKLNLTGDKGYVTLIGAGIDKTVITYGDYAGKDNGRGGTIGTTGSASATLQGSNFTAKNLTFANSFDRVAATAAGESGTQAVAVKAEGDKSVFQNVKFVGDQDTLYANKGRQYYKDCIIEGGVDFIFGAAQAVFENCEIVSISEGHVTAASTNVDQKYGYLFLNSKLTSKLADSTVTLGRPWQPGGSKNAIANVVYKNCVIGSHIKQNPAWGNMDILWTKAKFAEYKSTGAGAAVNDGRPQLTDAQAADYTRETVLDGWNPLK